MHALYLAGAIDLNFQHDVATRWRLWQRSAIKVANELREMGVNTAVDYSGKKIDKQLKSAIKSEVRYVLFVGEKELSDELYILKDLKTGKEERHSLQRIVSLVKDSRRK